MHMCKHMCTHIHIDYLHKNANHQGVYLILKLRKEVGTDSSLKERNQNEMVKTTRDDV